MSENQKNDVLEKSLESAGEGTDVVANPEEQKISEDLDSAKTLAEIESEIQTYQEFQEHEASTGETILTEEDHIQHEKNWNDLTQLDAKQDSKQEGVKDFVEKRNEEAIQNLKINNDAEKIQLQKEALQEAFQKLNDDFDETNANWKTMQKTMTAPGKKHFIDVKKTASEEFDRQYEIISSSIALLEKGDLTQDEKETVQRAMSNFVEVSKKSELNVNEKGNLEKNDEVVDADALKVDENIQNDFADRVQAPKEAKDPEDIVSESVGEYATRKNEEAISKLADVDSTVEDYNINLDENTQEPDDTVLEEDNYDIEDTSEEVTDVMEEKQSFSEEEIKNLMDSGKLEQEAYSQETADGIKDLYDTRISDLNKYIGGNISRDLDEIDGRLNDLKDQKSDADSSKDVLAFEDLTKQIEDVYKERDVIETKQKEVENMIADLSQKRDEQVGDLVRRQYRAERMTVMTEENGKMEEAEFDSLMYQLDEDTRGVRNKIYSKKMKESESDLKNTLKKEAQNIFIDNSFSFRKEKFDLYMNQRWYSKAKGVLLKELEANVDNDEYHNHLDDSLENKIHDFKQKKKLADNSLDTYFKIEDEDIHNEINGEVIDAIMLKNKIPNPSQRDIDTASMEERKILLQQKEYYSNLKNKLVDREEIQSKKTNIRRKLGSLKRFKLSFSGREGHAKNLRSKYNKLAGLHQEDEKEFVDRLKEDQVARKSAEGDVKTESVPSSDTTTENTVSNGDISKEEGKNEKNTETAKEKGEDGSEDAESKEFTEDAARQQIKSIFGETLSKKLFQLEDMSVVDNIEGYNGEKGIAIRLQGTKNDIVLSQTSLNEMSGSKNIREIFRNVLETSQQMVPKDTPSTTQFHYTENSFKTRPLKNITVSTE